MPYTQPLVPRQPSDQTEIMVRPSACSRWCGPDGSPWASILAPYGRAPSRMPVLVTTSQGFGDGSHLPIPATCQRPVMPAAVPGQELSRRSHAAEADAGEIWTSYFSRSSRSTAAHMPVSGLGAAEPGRGVKTTARQTDRARKHTTGLPEPAIYQPRLRAVPLPPPVDLHDRPL